MAPDCPDSNPSTIIPHQLPDFRNTEITSLSLSFFMSKMEINNTYLKGSCED